MTNAKVKIDRIKYVTLQKLRSITRLLSYSAEIPETLFFTRREINYWVKYSKSKTGTGHQLKDWLLMINKHCKNWNNFYKEANSQYRISHRNELTYFTNLNTIYVNNINTWIAMVVWSDIFAEQNYYDSINGFYYEEKGKKAVNEYNEIYVGSLSDGK